MKRCYTCYQIKVLSEFYLFHDNGKQRVTSSCKECTKKQSRIYYAKDPVKGHERTNNYRANNIENVREINRKAQQKYQAANLKKVVEKNRKWHAANPGKYTEEEAKRRARKKGNGGIITAQEWQALKKHYNDTCLCCKRREPEIKLTLDHVMPLVLGGKNIIKNAQPLCGSCNSRKNKKNIDYRISF